MKWQGNDNKAVVIWSWRLVQKLLQLLPTEPLKRNTAFMYCRQLPVYSIGCWSQVLWFSDPLFDVVMEVHPKNYSVFMRPQEIFQTIGGKKNGSTPVWKKPAKESSTHTGKRQNPLTMYKIDRQTIAVHTRSCPCRHS